MNSYSTRVACFADLRDHAVRLMKRKAKAIAINLIILSSHVNLQEEHNHGFLNSTIVDPVNIDGTPARQNAVDVAIKWLGSFWPTARLTASRTTRKNALNRRRTDPDTNDKPRELGWIV
jgi:hypothetical protein